MYDAKLVIIRFPPEFGRKISDFGLLYGFERVVEISGELWGISFNKA